jgi:hypothetical protein
MENQLFNFALMYSIMAICAIVYNIRYYHRYRKIYKSLKDKTFVRIGNMVFSCDEFGLEFVWIIDKNSFLLLPKVPLLNMPLTFFDPYSLYWLVKYQKWCKKNINLNTIETFKK